ncbi:TetR family transcriptional regulator [Pseudoclavibacter endophyticus]|uniref:TetR/AcrR family transcriptional regulator n=1 Tax=Pseudoclavibacter endophyticus TaxID=1778590 RepID=A0A6H9WC47_9MICO|nr:TetR/AcrR family transcriptional regulator [Pseudoclavibacter endophyticus]KAB1648240.1 TetR/AcrR family transcriptional regulator [Pseudoclavibacter endophyticus]GGA70919.1 TetR family transcriptional regulator [Pseudoclavibacter endophyticus]
MSEQTPFELAKASPDETTPDAPPAGQGRAALLRATIAVGLADGISGITSRSVAEAAGVAHSLVRYHFGTIDALITEALGLAIDEGLELGCDLASAATLSEFTERLVASVIEHQDTQAFLFEALLESRRRPDLFGQVERYYRDYREAFSSHFQRLGVTDQGLIDVIFFAFKGMVMKEVAYPDQDGTRGAIVWLQNLVLQHTGVPLGGAAPAGVDRLTT